MDRLDMAIAMIQEAKIERRRLEAMRQEINRIPANDAYHERRERIERSRTAPSEKAVSDYIVAAMRLLDRELY